MANVFVCTLHMQIAVVRENLPGTCGHVGECNLHYFGKVKWDRQWLVNFSSCTYRLKYCMRPRALYEVLLPKYGLNDKLDEMRYADAHAYAARSMAELRVRLPGIVLRQIRAQLRTLILQCTWPFREL